MDIFQVQESRKCIAIKEVKLITSLGTRTREEAMPPIAPAACNIVLKFIKWIFINVFKNNINALLELEK